MRKIPRKAILEAPKPIRIEIDPLSKNETIMMPEITYTVVASAEMKPQFTGAITPIPTALINLLTHYELKVFAIILEESYKTGRCALSILEIATRIATTTPTVSNTLKKMRKRGLLLETSNGLKSGKLRQINFKTIQHLNDLVEGEDPGVYARISRATRRTAIENLTKEDIHNAYDNKVLPPGHDPAEEEEYD